MNLQARIYFIEFLMMIPTSKLNFLLFLALNIIRKRSLSILRESEIVNNSLVTEGNIDKKFM